MAVAGRVVPMEHPRLQISLGVGRMISLVLRHALTAVANEASH
jgi:hypothetical protein